VEVFEELDNCIANIINYKDAKLILDGKEFPFYIDSVSWANNQAGTVRNITGKTIHTGADIAIPYKPIEKSITNCKCEIQDLIREGCKCGGI